MYTVVCISETIAVERKTKFTLKALRSVYIQSYTIMWVAKPIYEENSQFVHHLLNDTILLKKGEIEVQDCERPHLPQNIALNPRGNKEDIIARQVSRFQQTFHYCKRQGIAKWYHIVKSLL